MKPLCIDLFCGLGGWAEGFLSEGYDCIGFDIERHDYGTGGYPGQLVLQDVLTLHGSQFRDAAVIVASPPCQAYSYRAMPWKRAKALPPPSNELFDACFRIQREASEAAGRHIPMVVENVKGAQPFVGSAQWHYGSYYLWGDIPALMPFATGIKNNGGSWFAIGSPGQTNLKQNPDGRKVPGINLTSVGFNVAAAQRHRDQGVKQRGSGAEWFDKALNERRKQATAIKNRKDRPDYPYSPGDSRKAASAQIAKIPFPLAQWIARVYKPEISLAYNESSGLYALQPESGSTPAPGTAPAGV